MLRSDSNVCFLTVRASVRVYEGIVSYETLRLETLASSKMLPWCAAGLTVDRTVRKKYAICKKSCSSCTQSRVCKMDAKCGHTSSMCGTRPPVITLSRVGFNVLGHYTASYTEAACFFCSPNIVVKRFLEWLFGMYLANGDHLIFELSCTTSTTNNIA